MNNIDFSALNSNIVIIIICHALFTLTLKYSKICVYSLFPNAKNALPKKSKNSKNSQILTWSVLTSAWQKYLANECWKMQRTTTIQTNNYFHTEITHFKIVINRKTDFLSSLSSNHVSISISIFLFRFTFQSSFNPPEFATISSTHTQNHPHNSFRKLS